MSGRQQAGGKSIVVRYFARGTQRDSYSSSRAISARNLFQASAASISAAKSNAPKTKAAAKSMASRSYRFARTALHILTVCSVGILFVVFWLLVFWNAVFAKF